MVRILSLSFALPLLSCAAAITVGTVTNNSSANEALTGAGLQYEFRSNVTTTGVTQSGNNLSFQTRLAYMSAMQVEPGGPQFANIYLRHALFQTSFTVEDAANVGYSLLIETLLNGFISQRLDNPVSGNPVTYVRGSMGSGNFYLSVDGGPAVNIFLLSIGLGGLHDLTALGTANTAVTGLQSDNVGSFIGTHTFTISYESPGANTSLLLDNYQRGEVALRFGETPTHAGFSQAVTPGVDGNPASSLGMFTTVTAAFNGPITVVPEPSTFGLAAFAGVAVAALRRRPRA